MSAAERLPVAAAQVLTVASAEVAAAVPDHEYRRLLGLPPGLELSRDLVARAKRAREWYAANGRPFAATRRVELRGIGAVEVMLATGDVLTSVALADRLREGDAHALVVLAASAGPEVAEEATRLWGAGRPDEAYFLDRFAAVVAEGLVAWASALLCREFAPRLEQLLPHLSPGCGHWDLADQHRLMGLLTGRAAGRELATAADSCGPLTLLVSGALRPQHSLLAALGVTHRAFVATRESSCRCCDLDPCNFRRMPFMREHSRLQVTS